MLRAALTAALLLAGNAPPPRAPIDLGPDDPARATPQQIDILAPSPRSEAATAAVYKEYEERRERGVGAGEIVVCRALAVDTSQLYSGNREAWLKAYAERTQGRPPSRRLMWPVRAASARGRTALR